jgi:hypothetical protein
LHNPVNNQTQFWVYEQMNGISKEHTKIAQPHKKPHPTLIPIFDIITNPTNTKNQNIKQKSTTFFPQSQNTKHKKNTPFTFNHNQKHTKKHFFFFLS